MISKKKFHITFELSQNSYFREVIGRDQERRMLVDLILQGEKYINIHGDLGIGKSELCYYIFSELYQYNNYIIYEINARGCVEYESLLARFIEIFECVNTSYSKEILFYEISKVAKKNKIIIYFDNFEDCLLEQKIFNFIRELASISNNIQIVFSTRGYIQGTYNYKVKSLEISYCIKLFKKEALKNGALVCFDEEELKKFIIEQLDRHTLSIILVASNVYQYRNIDEIFLAWLENKDNLIMCNGLASDSLNLSVSFSYRMIMHNSMAVYIWSCLVFFPKEISYEMFDSIFSKDLEKAKEAVRILLKYNLISSNSHGYYMLQPIRDRIFNFVSIEKVLLNNCDPVDLIIKYYLKNYKMMSMHYANIVFMLLFLLRNNYFIMYYKKINLILGKLALNFKEHAYEVLPLLDCVERKILNFGEISSRSFYIQKADLHHIVGENKIALKYYDMAFKECNVTNVQCIIKIYRKKCEIYRLFQNREQAMSHCEEAIEMAKIILEYDEYIGALWQKSEIYRLIDEDYTNALEILLFACKHEYFESAKKKNDILWSIGEIYNAKGDRENAKLYIRQAINGYSMQNNQLGLAYAYLSMAKLNQLETIENAEQLYEKSLELFQSLGYDLGCGHAYFWKGKLCIEKGLNDAEKYLALALSKYQKVGYIAGIKDVEKYL